MAVPLAERAGGVGRRVADFLHFPRRTDISTLPFDERWVRAEKLSYDKRIAFVVKEVRTLLDLLDGGVEEKEYTYQTERTGRLVVTRQQIKESQLPPAIKAYILNPPEGTRLYRDWPTYDPTLELSTTDHRRTPHAGASTQFTIGLELVSSDKSIFRFGVGGEARERESDINIWISPLWNNRSSAELYATDAYTNYQALAREGYTRDNFVTARELIRFTHEVISARSQPPAPTPLAA